MSTYALSMDCPSATVPDVLWRVAVFDDVAKTGAEAWHHLWVPQLDTWTLDTLRMMLHELAAYLPAHETASVTITAHTQRRGGRPTKIPRPPTFSEEVTISVSARGWTVTVWTKRNEQADQDGNYLGRSPGEWSAPMQAVLLDLAAKSPFPLDTVRVVNCADPEDLGLRYAARRDVLRGIEPNEPVDRSLPIESTKKRIKRLIDDILGGDQ